MLTKKNICTILESEKIKIKKKWGQNFLISEKILEKITNTCKIKKDDTVLEIGAGMGNLTEYLTSLAEQVIAVEKDPELYKVLKNRMSLYPNVKVFCCDILNFKIPETGTKKIKVIGNLPYYASSDIIQYLISNRVNISSAYCTLQKEFADRIVSSPGSKAYGRLSVFTDYFSITECLFKIKKENFFPVPKVDSLFIIIKLRDFPKIKVKNENFFFEVVKAGFSERRKKLVNCITGYKKFKFSKKMILEVFEKIDLNTFARAEDVSIEKLALLSNRLFEIQETF